MSTFIAGCTYFCGIDKGQLKPQEPAQNVVDAHTLMGLTRTKEVDHQQIMGLSVN